MRSNFDYIFLLAEDFTNNRKRLCEHYAGMFPDFASFRRIYSFNRRFWLHGYPIIKFILI